MSFVRLFSGIATLYIYQIAFAQLPGVVKTDKFYDASVMGSEIWIVGFPGLILHSSDGGKTFEQQIWEGEKALFRVRFIDNKRGLICGRNGLILRTTDGGMRWMKSETGTNEHLLAVDLIEGGTGMAVGNFATAIKTENHGETWRIIKVTEEGEDPSLNDVLVLDKKTAIIVGEFGGIWRTEDGGGNFERIDSGVTGNLFGIGATSIDGITVVGSYGTILLSHDRGKSFTKMEPLVDVHLFRVTRTAKKVFIVGDKGMVLYADQDRGPYEVWKAPTYSWLGVIRIGAQGIGVLVGNKAFMMITRNFGENWRFVGEE